MGRADPAADRSTHEQSRPRFAARSRVALQILAGILTGAMVEEYLLLAVVLEAQPDAAWAELQARFAFVHPFTIIPLAACATGALVAVVFIERDVRSWRGRLTWLGVAAVAGIIVLTAAVMLPMNDAVMLWAETGVPADAAAVRARWITLQGVRALLAVVGFVAFVVGSSRAADPAPP